MQFSVWSPLLVASFWLVVFAPLHAEAEKNSVPSAPLVNGRNDLQQLDRKLTAIADKAVAATVCLTSPDGSVAGSGVVVSADGLILSASHVVAAINGDIIVLFSDGKRAKAKALGADFERDTAMIRITDTGTYACVDLAAPEKRLLLNSWCVALGHTAGYDPQRTPPLRLGRIVKSGIPLVTDCTVTVGDSGGPLLDLEGRLIGITSTIGSGLNENRHIPMQVFREQWDHLLAGKRTDGRFNKRKNEAVPPTAPKNELDELIDQLLAESDNGRKGIRLTPAQTDKFGGMEKFQQLLKQRLLDKGLGKANLRVGDPSHPADPKKEQDKEQDALIAKLRARAQANGGKLDITPAELTQIGGVEELKKRFGIELTAPDPFYAAVIKALEEITANSSASILTVFADNKPIALATVISADGGILTKDSETATGTITVNIDGKNHPATLIKRFPAWDLALFQIPAAGLRPLSLHAAATAPALGSLLIVPGSDSQPLGIGVLGVNRRPIGKSAYLGIRPNMTSDSAGSVIARVVEKDSPAYKAGVKTGDGITAINDQPIADPITFNHTIAKLQPNDLVKIDLLRGGEKLNIEVTLLESPLPREGKEFMKINQMSGAISPKLDGFPLALQHDIPLEPGQCGGPLLDVNGRCIGINVARTGRVSTLAIPAEEIAKLLSEARADSSSTKATPATGDQPAPLPSHR